MINRCNATKQEKRTRHNTAVLSSRFKSDLDLKNHIEMTSKSRCFPNQGIVDRVFREALMESPDHHRRHNKHQELVSPDAYYKLKLNVLLSYLGILATAGCRRYGSKNDAKRQKKDIKLPKSMSK